MVPGAETPYLKRHLDATLAAARVAPGARVLELGCGMGRFSLLMAARGVDVTGIDLSAELLEVLRAHDAAGRVRAVVGDASEADRVVTGPFDAVVGFFFLHHMDRLEPVVAQAGRLVRPGGRVVFCEPNGWNPSFYVQIALTPGMTWRGDGGVRRMRRRPFARAARAAGLEAEPPVRYGFLPPALANRAGWARFEERVERLWPWPALLAFQLLIARR